MSILTNGRIRSTEQVPNVAIAKPAGAPSNRATAANLEPTTSAPQRLGLRARFVRCIMAPFRHCRMQQIHVENSQRACAVPVDSASEDYEIATVVLKKIDTVVSLLNVYGFFKDGRNRNQTQALQKTSAYIEKYAQPNSHLDFVLQLVPEYLSSYSGPMKRIPGDREHCQRLSRQTVRNVVAHITQTACDTHLSLEQMQHELLNSRLDKTDSGLSSTLIATKEANLYSVHSTIDPTSQQTPALLKELVQELTSSGQQHKLTLKSNAQKNGIMITHGQGGFGKVKTAIDIGANTLKAAKKFDQNYKKNISIDELCDSAKSEASAVQLLTRLLSPLEQQHFVMPESQITTTGSKGQGKAYVFSELITKGDGSDAITRNHASSHAYRRQNNQLLTLMSQWILGIEVLEKYNLCHPDLKPSNTLDGKICDLADIVQYSGTLDLKNLYDGHYTHTAQYTPPQFCDLESIPSFRKSQEKQLFKAYNRFSLGLMLIEAATGNTVGSTTTESATALLKLPIHWQVRPDGMARKFKIRHGYRNPQQSIYSIAHQHWSPVEKAAATLGVLLANNNPLQRITAKEAKHSLPAIIRAYENNETLSLNFKYCDYIHINYA